MTQRGYDADSRHLEKEKELFQHIITNSPGNVYVDIGSHFGYFAKVIAEKIRGTEKRLICLEPDKMNYRCLERTMRDDMGNCRIELLPCALSDVNGDVELCESNTDCKHTYRDADVKSSVSYKVEGIRLDRLAASRLGADDRIAFIKVDIDGSESALFKGGLSVIRKHKPIIFIEFSPMLIRKAGEDPEEYFDMLNREFNVYWYRQYALQRVGRGDYGKIALDVKDGISDLLLTYSEYEYGTS